MKDSIIFYLSHYEVVKQLDNEQLGKLYRALFELALGNEPKVDEDIKIPFGFIKNQMVLDIEKYNEKRMKNKENGKLGGRPKKNATEEIEKPKKANGFFENPNDNENDNENDNDNENENDNDNEDEVDIYDFFTSNFGYCIPPIQMKNLDDWLKEFGNNSEIIKFAIKKCCDNNVRTFNYLEGILRAWKSKGFKTLEECKNEIKKVKGIPEWFDTKIEKKDVNLEKKQKIDELLKEYKNQ